MSDINVVTGLTTVEDFEGTPTLWMIGSIDIGNPVIETNLAKNGVQCAACNIGWSPTWIGGLAVETGDGGGINGIDLSANDCFLWIWAMLTPMMLTALETKNNGGLRLRLYSGTFTDDGDDKVDETNTWVEFWVGGTDTLTADWNRIIINPINLTPTNSNGVFDYSNITLIGFTYKLAINYVGGPARALFIDGINIGTGIEFSGGTSGDEIDLETISNYTEHVDRAWGICTYDKGVWRLNGKIAAGVTGEITHFLIDSELMLFENQSYYQAGMESSINYVLHEIKGIVGVSTNITITDSVLIGADNYGEFELNYDNSGIDVEYTSNTIINGHTLSFNSGQTYENITFMTCGKKGDIDTNGAVLNNTKFIGQKGSFLVNSSVEATNCSDLQFNGYEDNSVHAIHVDASVTSFTMDNWFFSDSNNTSQYAVYWAGTSGTLTISATNGTNLVTAGCEAATGGTVTVVSGGVSIDIHVEDQLAADLDGALVYVDEDLEAAGNIINTTTNSNGDVTTSYTGAATSATVRIRKYGYKPYVGTITLLVDTNLNVTLITDPQQT